MKKFKFKFQALHDKRMRLEEMAMKDHAAAQRRVAAARGRVSSLTANITLHFKQAQRKDGFSIDIEEVIREKRWLLTLQTELDQQREALAQAMGFAEVTRKALVHVSRERQVLTKLKDRHQQDWRREWLRVEQKEIDEIAGNVVQRRSS